MGNPSWGRGIAIVVLGVALASTVPARADENAAESREDLLTGYALLSQSLGSEENLKYLLWLRELTLQGPTKEVERLMTMIYETSSQRSEELEKLRKLSPPATAAPPPSPIGDAIQAAAQWDGTKEMLFPDGEFGMRFVFLQAQATRMISVIAEQTAKIDPNAERKKWLQDVGREFSGFREKLVKAVERCEPR